MTVKKIRKAVIPAAGFGTRFLPATKTVPKEMMPIVDKPAIQYVIEEAVASGIEEILIITSRYKKCLEDYFDVAYELEHVLVKSGKIKQLEDISSVNKLAHIEYVRQLEAKGLGHAVGMAKSFVGDEAFAVILPDDLVYSEKPCLKQLIDIFEEKKSSVIGVQKVPKEDVSKYGIVDGKAITEKLYEVNGLVEKPTIEEATTDVAIVGRYILTPEIFEKIAETKVGAKGEIQLTDALIGLLKNQSMYACVFDGIRYDTGNTKGYLKAVFDYAMRRDDIKDEYLEFINSRISNI